MRTKTIILGAIAALSLATLTANAGNLATHRVQGSVVSLVAATTAVAKADRDAQTARSKSTVHEPSGEPAIKPVVAVKLAAPKVLQTPACQQAISNLKAIHQADLTEDAAREQPASASALQADRAEDAAEAQQWRTALLAARTALLAARTACVPQPSAACQAAIAGLRAVVEANRAKELGERIGVHWPAALVSLKPAFGGLVKACGDRD